MVKFFAIDELTLLLHPLILQDWVGLYFLQADMLGLCLDKASFVKFHVSDKCNVISGCKAKIYAKLAPSQNLRASPIWRAFKI